jgi:photosystem II stability/assembly factor-like uncharacterized protein
MNRKWHFYMKTLFTTILILANYSALSAQSGWFQQQTGTDITLRSVYMVDNNTGYCVGGDILIDGNAAVDRGIILKTTSGGANWVILSPPNFDKMLFAVTFSNALTGYAVGRDNSGFAILKTSDGGLNWIQQEPPPAVVTPPLHSLYFFNSESGYTAGTGGKIFTTTNGGTNWLLQNFPNVSSLHSITFTTTSTGYIGADNALYRTVNNGTTWDTVMVLFGTSFKSVYFSDQNTGYAAGGDRIFKTTNGGNNWTSIEITGNFFSSIYFPSPNTGYCAGENFAIYRTTDAGISWARQTQPGSNPLHSIFFSNDSMGIATGNVGFMLRTTTGGTVDITVQEKSPPASGFIKIIQIHSTRRQ